MAFLSKILFKPNKVLEILTLVFSLNLCHIIQTHLFPFDCRCNHAHYCPLLNED